MRLPWEVDSKSIVNLIERTVGLRSVKPLHKLPIGSSKFGGTPDLPLHKEWPVINEVPLAFICQINLREIDLGFSKLPEKGLLYFFISVNQDDYRYEKNKNLHKVLFYNDNLDDLIPTNFPDKYNKEAIFKEAKIKFFEYFTLPSYDNFKIRDLELSFNDDHLLEESQGMINSYYDIESELTHQMLGHYSAVQNDLNYWWACLDSDFLGRELSEDEKEKISIDERKFELLLQIDMLDSIPSLDSFGADGALYFAMTKEDLAKKLFHKSKFALQNA